MTEPHSVTDLQWLLSEMERSGVSAPARERLLRLLVQVAEGGGLRVRELRATLRMHVAQQVLDSTASVQEARRRIAGLTDCTPRHANRLVSTILAQRTARLFAFGGSDGKA